jgi:Mlc titration factor MtfA (ptsG expression regulator)
MWHWIRDHRRKALLETPFPAEWRQILERNVVHVRRLQSSAAEELHALIQVFVAEKRWEGCAGLVMTDEIRVTIAAQACLLVLALPNDLYRQVDTILVYPSTVVIPERKLGFFEIPSEVMHGPTPILGEAQLRGPVILVWDSVLRNARHPERGHNVTYHEFAHQLDMLDGSADGTPPLESEAQRQRWITVCSTEFFRLKEMAKAGTPSFLDTYGAVNEAEFFAVVTEQFFDQPSSMKRHHPSLYDLLREFYRQDPAALDAAMPRSA